MSLVSRIAQAFRERPGTALQERFSKAGPLISLMFAGRPVWTPRNYKELSEESYEKNVVAFRAIKEISDCVGSVPFNLFSGPLGNRKEIVTHPLLDLLSRPNPQQSRNQFLASVAGHLLISGNSWIEKVAPRSRVPRELWTKRPDRMKVIPGEKGVPAAYEFSIGQGEVVTWPVNQMNGRSDIIHIKTFHPTNDWYGMSAIEAAAFSVDQHNESGKWNMWRLQNDGRPSGAFVIDPKAGIGLGDEEYQRLKAQIDDMVSGPQNAGRPLLLEGGADWKEMGLNAVDMDWMQGRFAAARDVAMAFGMPPQMLGIPGDNTHRNMEEARLWLWEQTIIPLLDFILSDLNWWLAPLFGEDLTLAFDLDEVPALVSRRHVLWDKVTNSDFLTVDEKREAVGYEKLAKFTDKDIEENPGLAVLVKKNTRLLGDKEAENDDPDGKDLNNPQLGTGKPKSKGNGKDATT